MSGSVCSQCYGSRREDETDARDFAKTEESQLGKVIGRMIRSLSLVSSEQQLEGASSRDEAGSVKSMRDTQGDMTQEVLLQPTCHFCLRKQKCAFLVHLCLIC